MRKAVFFSFFACVLFTFAADGIFHEPFEGKLQAGWTWIREDTRAWRLRGGALEIRIQPGNMWGSENSGKNVLVRPLPPIDNGEVVVSVSVENSPTGQYEQTDLVCYFDDSHMVKVGQELVDGKLSVVMGREEADQTRTIAILPLATNRVDLRFRLRGDQLTGQYRPGSMGDWQTAGQCNLPSKGEPKAAIQCYQGLPDQEHWAKIRDFRIERIARTAE